MLGLQITPPDIAKRGSPVNTQARDRQCTFRSTPVREPSFDTESRLIHAEAIKSTQHQIQRKELTDIQKRRCEIAKRVRERVDARAQAYTRERNAQRAVCTSAAIEPAILDTRPQPGMDIHEIVAELGNATKKLLSDESRCMAERLSVQAQKAETVIVAALDSVAEKQDRLAQESRAATARNAEVFAAACAQLTIDVNARLDMVGDQYAKMTAAKEALGEKLERSGFVVRRPAVSTSLHEAQADTSSTTR